MPVDLVRLLRLLRLRAVLQPLLVRALQLVLRPRRRRRRTGGKLARRAVEQVGRKAHAERALAWRRRGGGGGG